MAYIILSDRDDEIERRELHEAVTIGRSPDCEIPVRDVLLSRRHCRIEPHGRRWVLIDLSSRNGTRLDDQIISRHVLEDGDVVQIGRTLLCFRDGPYIPAPHRSRRGTRPLDPYDAMSSTVAGFEVPDMEEESRVSGFPIPKPKPAEPPAYHEDGVGVLVAKMASSVWDKRAVAESFSYRMRRPSPAASAVPLAHDFAPSTRVMEAHTRYNNHVVVRPALSPRSETEHRPSRLLIVTYLGCAWGVFAASLWTIGWQYFVR